MWQVAATPTSVLPAQLRSLVEREESTRAQAFQTALLEKQLAPYASLLVSVIDNLARIIGRERLKPTRTAAVSTYLETLKQHRTLALAAQPPPPPPDAATSYYAGDEYGYSAELPDGSYLRDSIAQAASGRGEHPSPPTISPGEASDVSQPPRVSGAGSESSLPRGSTYAGVGGGSGADASELSGYYTTDGGETSDGDLGSRSALVREIAELAREGASPLPPGISAGAPPASTSALRVDGFNLPWATEAPGEAAPSKEAHVVDEPPASIFRVRGPAYLSDRQKEEAEFHAMRLLGVDMVRSESILSHVAAGAGKAKLEALKAKHGDDLFLVNFQLPGRPGHLSVLLWFALTPRGRADERFYPLWREFADTDDDAFRNMRLKLMVLIPDGPFLLRKSVPGNKPVILGKGIRIDWLRGDGYLEADINIASSSSAEKMWGLVQAVTKSIVVDLALIIEAKEAHQLPERLFGAVRIMHVRLDEI